MVEIQNDIEISQKNEINYKNLIQQWTNFQVLSKEKENLISELNIEADEQNDFDITNILKEFNDLDEQMKRKSLEINSFKTKRQILNEIINLKKTLNDNFEMQSTKQNLLNEVQKETENDEKNLENEKKEILENSKLYIKIILNLIQEVLQTFRQQEQDLIKYKNYLKSIEASLIINQLQNNIKTLSEDLEKLKSEKIKFDNIEAIYNQEKNTLDQLEYEKKWKFEHLEKENTDLLKKEDIVISNYVQNSIDIQMKESALGDLKLVIKTLEDTLLKYHNEKMDELNKIIADTWKNIYAGDDIVKIEIKSEIEQNNSKKTKNYNYRLIYYCSNGVDIDMKGRCSMGQKVIASTVIRLSLAEAFGEKCGIFALDEPTTNLDKENKNRLAKELGNLIKYREKNENFQLILITHDKKFVEMLREYTKSFYEISKNEKGFTTIDKKPIEEI